MKLRGLAQERDGKGQKSAERKEQGDGNCMAMMVASECKMNMIEESKFESDDQ